MGDLAFYNVGCEQTKGPRGLIALVRRAARRVLRPFFVRQEQILRQLVDRLDAHDQAIASLRTAIEALALSKDAHERSAAQFEAHIGDLERFAWNLAHGQDKLAARDDELLRRDAELAARVAPLAPRIDEQARQVETLTALGWDHVALVRRLAVLEDQLLALTGGASGAGEEGAGQPSILFPGLVRDDDPGARSKVS